MHRLVRIPCLAVHCFSALSAGGGMLNLGRRAESPPETVTSDTLTYCHQLASPA